MKLSELKENEIRYTQLSRKVLAVLIIRIDGWCVYLDAVPGVRHSEEWQTILYGGQKQQELIARAIAENLFFPGFEINLPYAE